MKYICLWLLLSIGFYNEDNLSKNDKCKLFKQGKFKSSFVKKAGFTGYILRPNDSEQVEYLTSDNFSLTNYYTVRWHSSCHYMLYFVQTDYPVNNPFVKNDSIDVYFEQVLSDSEVAYKSIFKGIIMYDTLTVVR